MSSDVGQNPAGEPTHADRKDFSYVGISCTNYGYADYSRQHRNFSPVSRVTLDRPAGGLPIIEVELPRKSLSAVNSPDNDILIVETFERANNCFGPRGETDRPSVIAQRIQSLYGAKTKDEFKKRSKSAGPHVRNIYGPNYRQDFLELTEATVDPKKEQLKPSKFKGSVKERTAFVEQLLKKDVREGVTALEDLKKPPRFEIPSSKPSKEYYILQKELQKEREIKFNQRLKEAEKRHKAEAERQRLIEEAEQKERQARREAEGETEEETSQSVPTIEEPTQDHVHAIPEYSKIEQPLLVERVIVDTSFESNDSTGEPVNESSDDALDEVDRRSVVKKTTTTTISGNVTSGDIHGPQGEKTTKTTTVTTTVVSSGGTTTTSETQQTESITVNEQTVSEKSSPQNTPAITEDQMAGKEFIHKLDEAEERIRKRIATAETYLNGVKCEEILGIFRAAIGKGNLLLNQKCSQFRGLCRKNLQTPLPGEFPTTRADLEGFWDMICIQIDQIHDTFDDIDKLRANNWIQSS